jgi:hypothetical protein
MERGCSAASYIRLNYSTVTQSASDTTRENTQIDVCTRGISINAEVSMGGYGSGRRSNRPTTDDCLHINLSALKQLGMLKRQCMTQHELGWNQRGQTIAKLTLETDVHCLRPSPRLTITGYALGKVINCIIQLEEYALPYGGERWFALCPRTGSRCTTLVLPPGQVQFASVKGWNVPYASTRENEVQRAFRAMHKLEETRLPKHTRTSTRERHERRYMKASDTVSAWEERMGYFW